MLVSSLSLFTFQQKKVISLLEFQESLKKLYCTVLVIPYLLYIILDYSINSLPCHHSIYNFFFCCRHVSSFKNYSVFQL